MPETPPPLVRDVLAPSCLGPGGFSLANIIPGMFDFEAYAWYTREVLGCDTLEYWNSQFTTSRCTVEKAQAVKAKADAYNVRTGRTDGPP